MGWGGCGVVWFGAVRAWVGWSVLGWAGLGLGRGRRRGGETGLEGERGREGGGRRGRREGGEWTSVLTHKGASRQPSHSKGLSLLLPFFLGVFLLRVSCLAEMDVYLEMRRLIRFPHVHLSFVKLEASMLGYTPVCDVLPRSHEATAIS